MLEQDMGPVNSVGHLFFALALVHTFLAPTFHSLMRTISLTPAIRGHTNRSRRHLQSRLLPSLSCFFYSIQKFLFILTEVEFIFAFWSFLLVIALYVTKGPFYVQKELFKCSFSEPFFVLVMIVVASSRPILQFTNEILSRLANRMPGSKILSFYILCLFLGPLLGSLITEPAAMTITALLLEKHFFSHRFSHPSSTKLKYVTLATLFVNISIGGLLTPFAAPPVVMVAHTWGWDEFFMLKNFAWKVVLASFLNTLFAITVCWSEWREILKRSSGKQRRIQNQSWPEERDSPRRSARTKSLLDETEKSGRKNQILSLLFLMSVVIAQEHALRCGLILIMFMCFKLGTEKLHWRPALSVGVFLASLVFLGHFQSDWLISLTKGLSPSHLFLGAAGLTSITDNALLTYLGSKIPLLSDEMKYALVAGAVSGGGLTLIANAPNPAGLALLKHHFEPKGIQPLSLLIAALLPTLIALCCLF